VDRFVQAFKILFIQDSYSGGTEPARHHRFAAEEVRHWAALVEELGGVV